jgi:hypothetical protein
VVANLILLACIPLWFSVQASETKISCDAVVKKAVKTHPILTSYILPGVAAANSPLFLVDVMRHHGPFNAEDGVKQQDLISDLSKWISAHENLRMREFHFPRIKDQDPAVKANILKVDLSFRSASEEALRHILRGDIVEAPHASTPFSWRLKGGLHSHASHFAMLAEFLKDHSFFNTAILQQKANGLKGYLLMNSHWVRAPRELVEKAAEHIIAGKNANDFPINGLNRNEQVDLQAYLESIKALYEDMKSFGLDPHSDSERALYLLRYTFAHLISGPSKNGVIRVGFRSDFVQSKAWRKQMVPAVRDGEMAMGGKTFFPADWNENEIKNAIQNVLGDSNTEVRSLSRDQQGRVKNFVLEGIYKGVWIRVAAFDGKLISAYPAWNQERDMTVREVHEELGYSMEKLFDLIERLKDHGDGTSISTLEALDFYLGEDLAPRPGRNDSFWKLVFDPREYTNPGPMMEHDRATAQHHILKILRYSNLLRKLPKLSHDATSGYDSAKSPAQEPGELPLP